AVPCVGIVVDKDVAGLHALAAAISQRGFDGKSKVALKDRQSDTLRNHLNAAIEDGTAKVIALADDVAVSGLDQRDAHTFGGRIECSSYDFNGDRIHISTFRRVFGLFANGRNAAHRKEDDAADKHPNFG